MNARPIIQFQTRHDERRPAPVPLPADREPADIAAGLLNALFEALDLDEGYVRFDDPAGGRPVERWQPAGPHAPVGLLHLVQAGHVDRSGPPGGRNGDPPYRLARTASIRLAMDRESSVVVVSASRDDFPTLGEVRLLRAATGQALASAHLARSLQRTSRALAAAEETVLRQHELLRSLVDEVGPSLKSVARQVHEAARLVAEVTSAHPDRGLQPDRSALLDVHTAPEAGDSPAPALTRREGEVLRLVAEGLSNKEIAGVMRLSHRTVERHVTSLYRKIGVARRSAATAFALRRGVV